jgi:hypothetical protein
MPYLACQASLLSSNDYPNLLERKVGADTTKLLMDLPPWGFKVFLVNQAP